MHADEARRRGARFRELHAGPGVLVLPNPWDAGIARLFEHAGAKALATTSAGLAYTMGRRDGRLAVSPDETFAHVETLLAATTLPVTADLENGFGDAPETVAATIRRAGAVGLSGASIEDATYDAAAPLYERSLAVERIRAAVEAARALPQPFVLTARAENFIRGRPDFDDTLARLVAYQEAGADVLYAPGLPDADALRRVCGAVSRPVNVLATTKLRLSLDELREIGVRRISIGSGLARLALAAALRGVRELHAGRWDFLEGLPSVAECDDLVDPQSPR